MNSQVSLHSLSDSSLKVSPFMSNEPSFTTNASILAYLIKQTELINHFSTIGLELEHKLANMRSELSSITSKIYQKYTPEDSEPSIEDVRNVLYKEIHDYDYKLNLIDALPAPVCKGKYMSISAEIVPIVHDVSVFGTLSVSIGLFTSDCPPVLISQTACGRNIMKGNTSTMVVYDTKLRKYIARFRIQIREVTSRFKNGWVFMTLYGTNDEKNSNCAIRPLVIKRVVVKVMNIAIKRRNNL